MGKEENEPTVFNRKETHLQNIKDELKKINVALEKVLEAMKKQKEN